MPVYQLRCTECGRETEVSCRISDRNHQACTALYEDDEPGDSAPIECGYPLEVVITPQVAFTGALHSKPIDFSQQLGRKFETNAQWRQWQRDNPGARVISKTDPEYVIRRDDARNAMDRTARRQGFSDHEAKVQSVKRGEKMPSQQ